MFRRRHVKSKGPHRKEDASRKTSYSTAEARICFVKLCLQAFLIYTKVFAIRIEHGYLTTFWVLCKYGMNMVQSQSPQYVLMSPASCKPIDIPATSPSSFPASAADMFGVEGTEISTAESSGKGAAAQQVCRN